MTASLRNPAIKPQMTDSDFFLTQIFFGRSGSMLFWSVVRHARHLSTTVLTPNIKLGTVGLKNTLSWVLWGYWGIGGGACNTKRDQKRNPRDPTQCLRFTFTASGGFKRRKKFFKRIPLHSTRAPFLRATISSSFSFFSFLWEIYSSSKSSSASSLSSRVPVSDL